MTRHYFQYTEEDKAHIVEVLQTLAENPDELERFLQDRHAYLAHYREALSEDAQMAFNFDVNELDLQFTLDRGQGTGIEVEQDSPGKAKKRQKITIPDQEVVARHADGSLFFINKVFLRGEIVADESGGTLKLHTRNEPIDEARAVAQPRTTNVFAISASTESELITLQDRNNISIGPNLVVEAKYTGEDVAEAAGDDDKVFKLSGFVDAETQSVMLQFRDVTYRDEN